MRTFAAMSWRLSGAALATGVCSSSMAAEAASGALETQIGMCVCCALRLFTSMRCSDVGMSCSYDAYICLNAQKLLNSYTNTYGTGHNEADNRHDAQPTDTVNKRLRAELCRCALARLGFEAQAAQRPECEIAENTDADHLADRSCPARARHCGGVDELRAGAGLERPSILFSHSQRNRSSGPLSEAPWSAIHIGLLPV